MATIDVVLDELRGLDISERERGELFERLMVQYFTHDPLYAQRFSDVWMWTEWPGHEGADAGIDLVAKERDSDGYCAIQCKFFDPNHHLAKEDIDSFFTASGKQGFTSRIIVSTTNKWSSHAEKALADQAIPVARIGIDDIRESPIIWTSTWSRTDGGGEVSLAPRKTLRLHQTEAIEDVFAGWAEHDRGKLIMACGTGKTFTALKIAERVAAETTGHRPLVLFLVPSIALINQTLHEWTVECELPLRSFAVCSDKKVGRHSEDITAHDLAIPATTDADQLVAEFASVPVDGGLTVVFSTYQSIDVISEAQQQGVPSFDLIVCDEAHRTTGVTLADSDESHFVKVHDNDFLAASRRLYMTATPRMFKEDVKEKATEHEAVLYSMDDENIYGPEFHRLGFGRAVTRGLLTDYKVLILTIDEMYLAASLQSQVADENNEITLDDAVKIVGCWNGLAKKSGNTADGSGFPAGAAPMRRAVAFSRTIKESKLLTDRFNEVIDEYDARGEDTLRCEVDHVDGTHNALIRKDKLAWLREPTEGNTCRILSNARCLSEGVDIPALDAVMFLNPRNSVVDVVQSVGRVMRRADNKDYGYIILPVGIPSGIAPSEALKDNQRYKVIWQVLQALRAHDDRFDATVNKIELNKNKPNNIMVGQVDGGDGTDDGAGAEAQQLEMQLVEDWRDAIYAKIVAKVGKRTYWEQWAKDVAKIADRHVTRIQTLIETNPDKAAAFDRFVDELRAILNPDIGRDDALEMLGQHLITKPVFDAIFDEYDFAAHNPVSQTMQKMLATLDDQALGKEAEALDKFYADVRVRVEGIDNLEGRQRVIMELYEKFFRTALPKTVTALGIVYTPVEVVDFILRAANQALEDHFDTDLSAEGVQILDPFAGTGTFIARLIQSGLIEPEDLHRKYASELHANEIVLLAYYIAAINIEAAYYDTTNDATYTPFDGIVLTDTFQLAEDSESMDAILFPVNNERVERQRNLDIRVIVGNPPYSVGQTSANDDNPNLAYPALDKRVRQTFGALSTARSAASKTMLKDSYIRAIRWSADRIGDAGIVCYVSNGGYIDGNAADGLRKTLADEFSVIYVYNLRGNARTSGERRRKEKGNVFGSGSRATVAILLLVRTADRTAGCEIFYRDIGDYLGKEQKLAIIASDDLQSVVWSSVTPNEAGDWINQRDPSFLKYTPLGTKTKQAAKLPITILDTYSRGLETSRDAWVYNYSRETLETVVARTIDAYNQQVDDFASYCTDHSISQKDRKAHVDDFVDTDPTRISWTGTLKNYLRRELKASYGHTKVRTAVYRPFCKQQVYFDKILNHSPGLTPLMYPMPESENYGFLVSGIGSWKSFAVLAVDMIPDVQLVANGQFFARYRYEEVVASGEPDLFSRDGEAESGFRRIDNITDQALADYQATYGPGVTRDDVFYYAYGLLHSPEYRQRFSADLKKMLPRIPKVTDFWGFAEAGRTLADMHIGYETVDPYPLTEEVDEDRIHTMSPDEFYRVEKMRYVGPGKNKDTTRIKYNRNLTLAGIPDQAHEYMLGGRSAIDWIIDRYRVKTDKKTQIVNDPNDWSTDPRYIVDLLKRVVTVSVKTVEIVEALPPLDIIDTQGG